MRYTIQIDILLTYLPRARKMREV